VGYSITEIAQACQIELNDSQQDSVPALEWLFDMSHRRAGSGRTTLLVLAFINAAMNNPGTHIPVRDHMLDVASLHPTALNVAHMLQHLTRQVEESLELPPGSFTIETRRPPSIYFRRDAADEVRARQKEILSWARRTKQSELHG